MQRRGQIVFALAKFFRSLVTIEMLTGFLSLTHPEEISAYVTAWEQLLSIAVRGRAARALIRDALAALDGPASLGNAHLFEGERFVLDRPGEEARYLLFRLRLRTLCW